MPRRPISPWGALRALLSDQRVKFLMVGGFNTLQGLLWFALFQPLTSVVPYLLVLVLVYVVSIPTGFVLYRSFVFADRGPWLPSLARFTLVQCGGFVTNLVALPLFHEVLGIALLPAQALAVVVIVVLNYTGHLYFSFRDRGQPAGATREQEPAPPGRVGTPAPPAGD